MEYTNGRSISRGRSEGTKNYEAFGHLDEDGRRIGLNDANITAGIEQRWGFHVVNFVRIWRVDKARFSVACPSKRNQDAGGVEFDIPIPTSGWTIRGFWGQEGDGAFHRLGVVWGKDD